MEPITYRMTRDAVLAFGSVGELREELRRCGRRDLPMLGKALELADRFDMRTKVILLKRKMRVLKLVR